MRALLTILCTLLCAQGALAEVFDDADTPEANAVVALGICTGTLIAPSIVLTAAHCVPVEWRRPGEPAPCETLRGQRNLAKTPSAEDVEWREIALPADRLPRVWFGPNRQAVRFSTTIQRYAIPHCADIALLGLFALVPTGVAVPVRPIAEAPSEGADWLATQRLTFAGFGATDAFPQGAAFRQTGKLGYWSANLCHLFALPPEREPGGPRILRGDSGSPMLVETPEGRRVAGVLYGSGVPDVGACGPPALRPPGRHGTYTPTWRSALPGTGATDIGAWLRRLAPEAFAD